MLLLIIADTAGGPLPDRVVVAFRCGAVRRDFLYTGITSQTTGSAILEWLLTHYTSTAKSGELDLFVIPQAAMPLLPTPEELNAPTAIPWPEVFTLQDLADILPTRVIPTMAHPFCPEQRVLLLKAMRAAAIPTASAGK
jgi:hypothetical protein